MITYSILQDDLKLTPNPLGATLKDCVTPGQPPHITGSAMLVYALSRDYVLARLKNDPLVKERIWDLENATIHPFFRPKRGPV